MDLILANTDVGLYAWIEEIVASQGSIDIRNSVSKRIEIGGIDFESTRIFRFYPCSMGPLSTLTRGSPYSKTIEKRRNGSNAIIHDPACRPFRNIQTETRSNLSKLPRVSCGAKPLANGKKQIIVAESSGSP